MPVAKLTHPLFMERQDYKDEVPWVSLPREFVELVLVYLRDVQDKRPVFHVGLGSFFSVGEVGIKQRQHL
jgi:hypothetical protein